MVGRKTIAAHSDFAKFLETFPSGSTGEMGMPVARGEMDSKVEQLLWGV
jgi:hypothetical protein